MGRIAKSQEVPNFAYGLPCARSTFHSVLPAPNTQQRPHTHILQRQPIEDQNQFYVCISFDQCVGTPPPYGVLPREAGEQGSAPAQTWPV